MPRAKTHPPIKLQERDYELLRGLFHCRLLTIKHAAALHFRGREEAARKRLGKLEKAGYIKCRPGKFNEPNIYIFTKAGFDKLQGDEQLGRYTHLHWTEKMTQRARLKDRELKHELRVMDVKAVLEPSINALKGFSVVEFGTWTKLYQFTVFCPGTDAQGYTATVRETMKPDGFLEICEQVGPDELAIYYLFFEVDKGSQAHWRLAEKMMAYSAYYQSGHFAEHYGHTGARKEDFPFRVLFILESDERLNNLCEYLLQQGQSGLTQAWLTTASRLLAHPLGPVWLRPKDYLTATARTPYDPAKREKTNIYVRDPARERYIEHRVRRWGLFDDPR